MSKIQIVWFRDLSLWDFNSNGFNSSNELFKSKYPLVKISEFLKRNKTQTIIKDEILYIRVTISGKASFNGAMVRDKVYGKNIGIKKQYKIKEGQFLVSKIGAGDGAFGIATNELNEAIITSDFWAFDCNQARINPYFLLFVVKTKKFISFARASSSGTALKRMNENKFLGAKIPLPPLEIQNKIVADIHAIQTKIKALQVEEKRLKDEIEAYIYITLGLQKPQSVQKQKVFVVRFKNLERWDIVYNQNAYSQTSTNAKLNKHHLQELCDINPSVDMKELIRQDKNVSFIPMERLETDGKSFAPLLKKASLHKGFSKFQNDDLLWAKITPCMQNKKSVIVKGLENGVGFGSTEFFVLRSKDSNQTDIHFILQILRTDLVIEQAKLHFKGSAGQQRVPKEFLENLQIPLPPLQIQKEMVETIEQKTSQISKMSQERIALQNSIESKLQEILRN